MSFFSEAQITKYLYCLEKLTPVNSYIVQGLHVWPILRIYLTTQIKKVDWFTDEKLLENPTWIRIDEKIEHLFTQINKGNDVKTEIDLEQVSLPKYSGNQSPIFDCLFFSRHDEHYLRTEEGWFAPILDSWLNFADKRWNVQKFEHIQSLDRMPRVNPPVFVIDQSFSEKSHPENKHNLIVNDLIKLTDVINNFNKKVAIPFKIDHGNNLDIFVHAILNNYNWAFQFLHQNPCKALMLTTWYHSIAMGLIWAANDLGIPTIDLQHGCGEYQVAYTHWGNIPRGGYKIVPRIFNVWGKTSKENMLSWHLAQERSHHVVVGGKVSIDAYFQKEQEIGFLETIRRDYQTVVLVTLSSIACYSLTSELLGAIKRSPKDWFWLIRCHPMAGSSSTHDGPTPENVNRLISSNFTRYEVNVSSQLPIEKIFPFCDHHITHTSSAAIEALGYNIPSTMINVMAKYSYRQMINSGIIKLAMNSDEIIDSIKKIKANDEWKSKIRKEIVNSKDQHRSFLNSIIS
ncbi:MAG: hypothetical protein CMJ78_00990 [Planctomycetaceae bacterium]|nr:hypothetical protein [Planctomycetaceae bacterium]